MNPKTIYEGILYLHMSALITPEPSTPDEMLVLTLESINAPLGSPACKARALNSPFTPLLRLVLANLLSSGFRV